MFSTVENHRLLFKRYIEPRWGGRRLGAVCTMGYTLFHWHQLRRRS
jgi:hypothetical protein